MESLFKKAFNAPNDFENELNEAEKTLEEQFALEVEGYLRKNPTAIINNRWIMDNFDVKLGEARKISKILEEQGSVGPDMPDKGREVLIHETMSFGGDAPEADLELGKISLVVEEFVEKYKQKDELDKKTEKTKEDKKVLKEVDRDLKELVIDLVNIRQYFSKEDAERYLINRAKKQKVFFEAKDGKDINEVLGENERSDQALAARILRDARQKLIDARGVKDKEGIVEAKEEYDVAYQEFIRTTLEKESFKGGVEKRANFLEKTLAYEDRIITKKLAEFQGEQGEQNKNVFRRFVDWSNKGSLLDLFLKGRKWREKLERIKSGENESSWLKKMAASVGFGMTKYRTGISILLAGGAAMTAFTGFGAPISLGLLATRKAVLGVGAGYGTYDGLDGLATAMGSKKMMSGVGDFDTGMVSMAKLRWKLSKAERTGDTEKMDEIKEEIRLVEILKEKGKNLDNIKKDGGNEELLNIAGKDLEEEKAKFKELKINQLEQQCEELENKDLIKKLEYYEGQARGQEKKIEDTSGYESYKIVQAEFRSRLKTKYEELEAQAEEVETNFASIIDWAGEQRTQAENQIEDHISSQKNQERARKMAGVAMSGFVAIGLPRVIVKGFLGGFKEGFAGLKDVFKSGIIKGEANFGDLLRGFGGFKEGMSEGWEKVMGKNKEMLEVFLSDNKAVIMDPSKSGEGLEIDQEVIKLDRPIDPSTRMNSIEDVNNKSPIELVSWTQADSVKARVQLNEAIQKANISPEIKIAIIDKYDKLADIKLKETFFNSIQDSSKVLNVEDSFKNISVTDIEDKVDKIAGVKESKPVVPVVERQVEEKALEDLEVGDSIGETYTGQFEEATVPEGKGVIYALYQQLSKHPDQFGYNAKTDGDLESWASKFANKEGMKNYGDTWVKKPDEVAYVLKGNAKEGFSIHEVDPTEKKIMGTKGMDDHEMDPIEVEKKPVEYEIKEPEMKMRGLDMFDHEATYIDKDWGVIQFEDQYEAAETEADQRRVIKSFNKYLESNIGMEKVGQVDNIEMLEDLSKSHNKVIASIAEDTKEKLISQGSPTERIVNFLELEKPTKSDFGIIRRTFEQFGKESTKGWGENSPQQARLFASYIVQSDDILRKSISNGSGDYLNNSFHDFLAKSHLRGIPTDEVWQPRMEIISDGKGGSIEKYFNVKPQHHLHKSTDYLIDFGDGQKPKLVQENTLEDLLDQKKTSSNLEAISGGDIGVPERNFIDDVTEKIHNGEIKNEEDLLKFAKETGQNPDDYKGVWDRMSAGKGTLGQSVISGHSEAKPVNITSNKDGWEEEYGKNSSKTKINTIKNKSGTYESQTKLNENFDQLDKGTKAFDDFIDPVVSFEDKISSLKGFISNGETVKLNNFEIFRSKDGNDFYYITEPGRGIKLTPDKINKLLEVRNKAIFSMAEKALEEETAVDSNKFTSNEDMDRIPKPEKPVISIESEAEDIPEDMTAEEIEEFQPEDIPEAPKHRPGATEKIVTEDDIKRTERIRTTSDGEELKTIRVEGRIGPEIVKLASSESEKLAKVFEGLNKNQFIQEIEKITKSPLGEIQKQSFERAYDTMNAPDYGINPVDARIKRGDSLYYSLMNLLAEEKVKGNSSFLGEVVDANNIEQHVRAANLEVGSVLKLDTDTVITIKEQQGDSLLAHAKIGEHELNVKLDPIKGENNMFEMKDEADKPFAVLNIENGEIKDKLIYKQIENDAPKLFEKLRFLKQNELANTLEEGLKDKGRDYKIYKDLQGFIKKFSKI